MESEDTAFVLLPFSNDLTKHIATYLDFPALYQLKNSCKGINALFNQDAIDQLLLQSPPLTASLIKHERCYNDALIRYSNEQPENTLFFTHLWTNKYGIVSESEITQIMKKFRGKVWSKKEIKQNKLNFKMQAQKEAFLTAAKNNDLATVQILLAAHIDINGVTSKINIDVGKTKNFGDTKYNAIGSALQIACRFGHTQLVQLLLEKNASTDLCIRIASYELHHKVLKALLESDKINLTDTEYPLHFFIKEAPCHWNDKYEHYKKTLIVLLTKYDVNEKAYAYCSRYISGATPLHLLIYRMFEKHYGCSEKEPLQELIQLLLDNGADATIKDYELRTPMDLAVGLGNEKLIQDLRIFFNYPQEIITDQPKETKKQEPVAPDLLPTQKPILCLIGIGIGLYSTISLYCIYFLLKHYMLI